MGLFKKWSNRWLNSGDMLYKPLNIKLENNSLYYAIPTVLTGTPSIDILLDYYSTCVSPKMKNVPHVSDIECLLARVLSIKTGRNGDSVVALSGTTSHRQALIFTISVKSGTLSLSEGDYCNILHAPKWFRIVTLSIDEIESRNFKGLELI